MTGSVGQESEGSSVLWTESGPAMKPENFMTRIMDLTMERIRTSPYFSED
jgi:hypothetical protein